ncbi:MAG: MFS transporter, partial [Streptococcaceae bacterium]|nr:MFS transporter [Streptococcaceae bacterium]
MKLKNIHYGWVIIGAALILALAAGLQNTLSLYVHPVTQELGFSRGEFVFFRTLTMLTAAFLMPLFGRLSTKYSIKKMALVGTTLNGLSLAALGLAQNLWHFYAIGIFSGLVLNAGGFVIIGILINRWFEDKKATAMGIAFSGTGLGAAVMNPVSTCVINNFGWRNAFFFAGAVTLIIVIPTILLLIKDTPQEMGLQPYREVNSKLDHQEKTITPKVIGMTYQEAKKTPKFWLLAIGVLCISIIASAPNTHTVPYLIDMGYSTGLASAVITVCMIFQTIGKIGIGAMADKFGAMSVAIFFGITSILVPVFALGASNPISPWMIGTFMGLSSVGFSMTGNIFGNKFFGPKDFASIFSRLSMIATLGGGFAPPVMGMVFDLTGSYIRSWIALLVLAIVI